MRKALVVLIIFTLLFIITTINSTASRNKKLGLYIEHKIKSHYNEGKRKSSQKVSPALYFYTPSDAIGSWQTQNFRGRLDRLEIEHVESNIYSFHVYTRTCTAEYEYSRTAYYDSGGKFFVFCEPVALAHDESFSMIYVIQYEGDIVLLPASHPCSRRTIFKKGLNSIHKQ